MTTLAQAALAMALAVALYAPGLAVSPPHLTHDEIKFALQAKSIADTGRDINGRLLPLYFIEPGFAVGRDPLCIYVTAAFLRVLPLSERSIRLATVFVGALGVAFMFVFVRLAFRRPWLAWVVVLIFALSPTYYIHSRLALSVVYPVPIVVAWLTVLTRYVETRSTRAAAATGAVLGVGFYSYLGAALMMPVYLAATILIMAWQRDRRAIGAVLIAFAALMLPLVVWQLVEPNRYANILSAYRLYDAESTSGAGLLQGFLSASGLVSRIDILWDAFNPGRLFFTGESSLQISTRLVGSFLTPVAVLLGVGVLTILRRRSGIRPELAWLALAGLLTAPLPAVIMADVEIRRWLVVVPFVAVVAGIGVERLLSAGSRARALAVVLVMLLALQFAMFARDYFGSYRERSSVWFGGNIRAALETVLDDAQRRAPSTVYIATEIAWVEAYWRFYSKVRGLDLLDRTHYIRLSDGEIPRAPADAVIVAPAPDAAAAAKFADAGWVAQRIIPDLDGRPSMMVATGATP